ncbi:MAG: TauD/TfdA family dioxygenase [Deltaproteobacteria bacterium]|nr:TauD/TfdA family dioxygenase [Deltaproteobacteria bacterium]
MTTHLQIRGLSGALGAELRGIDLSRPLDSAERKALEEALYRYGVLCIRG